jgi:hypothetical protein
MENITNGKKMNINEQKYINYLLKEIGNIQTTEQHKKKFGIEPYTIGMFWNNPYIEIENIINAIETNTPYNEYEMLTKEEQKAFDNGTLLF